MDSQDPNLELPISNITDRFSAINLSVDDDFTFAVSFPAISDDIAPPFPLFNRELLSDLNPSPNPMELRSGSASSASSSSSIELDEDNYCAWNGNRARKRSASTGSGSGVESGSKSRWRKMLEWKRSVSDGKDRFGNVNAGSSLKSDSGRNGKKTDRKEMDLVTAHKLFYGKETKNEKKTFLPYRKQLVGLW